MLSEYALNDHIDIRSGYALDMIASPKWVINRVGLHANVHIIDAGIGYDWGNIGADAAYELAFGKIEIRQDGTNLNPGRYEAQVHGFNLSLHYAI